MTFTHIDKYSNGEPTIGRQQEMKIAETTIGKRQPHINSRILPYDLAEEEACYLILFRAVARLTSFSMTIVWITF